MDKTNSIHSKISLNQLSVLRTAPDLEKDQYKFLFNELLPYMNQADWFTVGIMASSASSAVNVLREIEKRFKWNQMKISSNTDITGPVYLKANQKTGEIYVRIEYGLGEGILISCQHDDINKDSNTLGPFPLNFFHQEI
ncbi:DUF1824 family protein [Prochlorococcus sp. MIT 1223]|uniref:DUF1824 family protein n=1 Tax=Prochlorococcus sp. MIT 1223 TaxID=3096217 RepID=UPI002A765C67|nr:DUF1824 family protein [Prochlorococcus sp. MIT 1223]